MAGNADGDGAGSPAPSIRQPKSVPFAWSNRER